MNLQIDVISDVVCPWCFIGKRRLEQALRQFQPPDSELSIEVRWRPFQLNPDLPASGMERAEYLKRKFGASARDIYSRVSQVGRSVGIEFAFEPIARQPNTVDAHQLIWLAGQELRQDAMVETLFQAYFLEGADLTDRAVLLQLAVRAGLPALAAQNCLTDQSARQAVVRGGAHGTRPGRSRCAVFRVQPQICGLWRPGARSASAGDRDRLAASRWLPRNCDSAPTRIAAGFGSARRSLAAVLLACLGTNHALGYEFGISTLPREKNKSHLCPKSPQPLLPLR